MRLIIAAIALTSLVACARTDGSIHYSGNPNDRHTTADGTILDGTGRLINSPDPDACDPSVTKPLLIAECYQRRQQSASLVKNATMPTESSRPVISDQELQRQREFAASVATANEHYAAMQQARAQCTYETSANMTNFRGGILMEIATQANLFNLCMQARR